MGGNEENRFIVIVRPVPAEASKHIMMGFVGFQLLFTSFPAEISINIQNILKIHQICVHCREYVMGFRLV